MGVLRTALRHRAYLSCIHPKFSLPKALFGLLFLHAFRSREFRWCLCQLCRVDVSQRTWWTPSRLFSISVDQPLELPNRNWYQRAGLLCTSNAFFWVTKFIFFMPPVGSWQHKEQNVKSTSDPWMPYVVVRNLSRRTLASKDPRPNAESLLRINHRIWAFCCVKMPI